LSGNKKKSPITRNFVSLRWAVGGVFVVGILARLIGLVREIIIAGSFGTSNELDAVFLGLSVPLALSLGIGGGVSRAMIPLMASLERSYLGSFFLKGRRRLFRLTIPLAGVLAISSPFWASLLIPANSSVPYSGVLLAGFLGCLGLIGGTYAGYCMGVANSQAKHVTAATSPLVYNLIFISAVMLLAKDIGAYSVLVGIVLAEWGQILPLVGLLRKIQRKTRAPRGNILDQAQKLAIPAIILAVMGSTMSSVDRYFSAGLEEGAVSALVYADRLHFLPVMLIGLSLQQPLFTRLSKLAGGKSKEAFERTLELGLRLLLLASAPIVVIFCVLAVPLTALLYQRGQFTLDDTLLTAVALRGYSAAILFKTMIPLLVGAALAKKRAWSLVFLYFVMFVLNGILDYMLVEEFGLMGISLTTSIVSGITVIGTIAFVAPRLFARNSLWRAIGISAWFLFVGFLMGGFFLWMFELKPRTFFESFSFLVGGALFISALAGPLTWKMAWGEAQSLRRLVALAGQQYVNASREQDVR
jgi:putative peptidoglycan lipid II flippase